MKGISNPDGWVRLDFPGGWDGDKKNAFTGDGLNTDEIAIQNLVKTLGNFRKKSSALKTGKLMQFIPSDGVYVYFRYDATQTIMCVMNTADNTKEIGFDKYAERTNGFSKAVNILTNETYNTTESLKIPSNQLWILELKK